MNSKDAEVLEALGRIEVKYNALLTMAAEYRTEAILLTRQLKHERKRNAVSESVMLLVIVVFGLYAVFK